MQISSRTFETNFLLIYVLFRVYTEATPITLVISNETFSIESLQVSGQVTIEIDSSILVELVDLSIQDQVTVSVSSSSTLDVSGSAEVNNAELVVGDYAIYRQASGSFLLLNSALSAGVNTSLILYL